MYLPKQTKDKLDPLLDKIVLATPQELGYAFIRLTLNHLDMVSGELSDAMLYRVVGVIERAKHEFITRVIGQNDTHIKRITVDTFHDFIRRRNI